MKKILALALAMLMAMSVVAAPVAYKPNDKGEYSAGYTEGTKGSYYALLVVSGIYAENETPAISEETVLYIDQSTGDANGDVSFDGWIPRDDVKATVYLGGSDLPNPVILGYLGAEEKFTVAGKVSTDSNTTYEATVTLTNGTDTYTVTTAEGTYSVEIPEGTYTFKVTLKNHLSYTDNDFAVSENVAGKNVSLKGGDIDGKGSVDYEDYAAIVNNFLTDNADVDIDGNVTVDYDDYAKVVNNFGATAVVE